MLCYYFLCQFSSRKDWIDRTVIQGKFSRYNAMRKLYVWIQGCSYQPMFEYCYSLWIFTVISVMLKNTFLTRIDIILYFSRGCHDIRIKVGWVRIEHLLPFVFRRLIIPCGPYVILRNILLVIRNTCSVLSTHLTYCFLMLNHSSSLQNVLEDITV